MSVEFADGSRLTKYDRCSTETTLSTVEYIQCNQEQTEHYIENVIKPDHELLLKTAAQANTTADALNGAGPSGLSYDGLVARIREVDILLLYVGTLRILRIINWLHPFYVVYQYSGRWSVGLIRNDELSTKDKRRMIRDAYKSYIANKSNI